MVEEPKIVAVSDQVQRWQLPPCRAELYSRSPLRQSCYFSRIGPWNLLNRYTLRQLSSKSISKGQRFELQTSSPSTTVTDLCFYIHIKSDRLSQKVEGSW